MLRDEGSIYRPQNGHKPLFYFGIRELKVRWGSSEFRAQAYDCLPVSGQLDAAAQIYIPDRGLSRHADDSNFTLASGTDLTDPHHPELGDLAAELNFQNLPCTNPAMYTAHRGSAAADIRHAGQLHERLGMRIDSPDTHRKHCHHPQSLTVIHEPSPRTGKDGMRQVAARKLTRVTHSVCPK